MLLAHNDLGASQHVVVVTGAGSGLGRALAIEFTERNIIVVGLGRRRDALDETARLTKDGLFVGKTADIGDPRSVAMIFDQIHEEFGAVTILINNAAVYPRIDFLRETCSEFMDAVAVNLGGVVACTKAALSSMTLTGRGRIINVGSFADLAPQPVSAAYSVSKGAARILSQAIVADLSDRFPNIVLTTWMPGILATSMGRPDGLSPNTAAVWGVNLALLNDPTLNGAVFEKNLEILPGRSLKTRLLERLLLKPQKVARTLC